jgi:hypothetical protein
MKDVPRIWTSRKATGGTANEPMWNDPKHTSLAASQERRARASNQGERCIRTPRSAPHFTRNTVSNQHCTDAMGKTRRSSDRKRAPEIPRSRWKNALDCQGNSRGAGLGFSMVSGESPQKIGMVGCETSRGKFNSRCRLSIFRSLHKYIPKFSSLSQ